MRVAFNITRMNWYRVMSGAIDEALRRGYDVVCWHNIINRELGDNFPDISKVPKFKNGVPEIVEYQNVKEMIGWISARQVDVIIECIPPPKELMPLWPPKGKRPYWVLLDAPPCAPIIECNDERQLFACDLFAMQTEESLENAVGILTSDHNALIQYAHKHTSHIGSFWEEYLRTRYGFQWQHVHKEYFLSRAVVTGNSGLDIIHELDFDEIKVKYNIPQHKPVVTLLPCPFEWGQATWQKCFMSNNFGIAALRMLRGLRFDMIGCLSTYVTDNQVVKAINKFCKSNDAIFLAKLRHSRTAHRRIVDNADMIIEKEAYHPHTTQELYKISDLVIGYYSTGCMEAVAMGAPYLNVGIPYYPNEFMKKMWPPFDCYDPYEGCMYEMSANKIVKELPSLRLQDFPLHNKSQDKYLQRFVGSLKGNNSRRLFDSIEYLVKNGEPDLSK